MNDYGVQSGAIYNMDKTGFMVGQGGSEHILVPDGDKAARFKAQLGSREWASVIECIGSAGQVLPPLVITKGCIHTVGEQWQMENVPITWRFSKSDNGWSDNKIARLWVEKVFDPKARLSS